MTQLQVLQKIQELNETKGFLGQEYLTWLWYFIDACGGEIKLEEPKNLGVIQAWIEDKMNLEAPGSHVHKQSLRGGTPSDSAEAMISLLGGKTVTELKLGLRIFDNDYSTTLNHKDLTPRGVILPKAEEGSSLDQYLEHQVDHLELLYEALDGLFKAFIHERLSETWQEQYIRKIQNWIQERRPKAMVH